MIRFYLDEDVLPLGKVLAGLRDDVAHPGHPASPDGEPLAAGLVVITRDRRIEDHLARIAAVAEHRARLVVITGPDAGGTWGQLEVVLTQWRGIEVLSGREGPSLHAATRSGLRPVPLRPPARRERQGR